MIQISFQISYPLFISYYILSIEYIFDVPCCTLTERLNIDNALSKLLHRPFKLFLTFVYFFKMYIDKIYGIFTEKKY